MQAQPSTPNHIDARGFVGHRWGIILAGGDGKRLLPLTRRIAGDDRPKQFCRILSTETLLDQTRRRVAHLVEPHRTVLVVTKAHELFYAGQLGAGPLLVQPSNRGTAPAILCGLLLLSELDPAAVAGIFPSDHHFANEEGFVSYLDIAYAAAESYTDWITLLGVAPESPEVAYGWIEPGAPVPAHLPGTFYQVNRFWEKPSLPLATALMKGGCLWNTFVMVGRVRSFLKLIRRALPELFAAVDTLRRKWGTAAEPSALADIYARIECSSFSTQVLAESCPHLAVYVGQNLGWSDLGETERVLSILRSNRQAAAPLERSAQRLGAAG